MDEDEIRAPDDPRTDRLLSPFRVENDEDEEFSQALELSMREFREFQRRIEEEDREKERLRRHLAIPISRLRLWRNSTKNKEEKDFLDFILERVHHRLYNDLDYMPILPEIKKESFHRFIHTQFSPQFDEIVKICKDCTNRFYS